MFKLYEGNRKTWVMIQIAEGTHNDLGKLMDARANIPSAKNTSKPFYALYSSGRLVSSTY